jgi:hypothetical protein
MPSRIPTQSTLISETSKWLSRLKIFFYDHILHLNIGISSTPAPKSIFLVCRLIVYGKWFMTSNLLIIGAVLALLTESSLGDIRVHSWWVANRRRGYNCCKNQMCIGLKNRLVFCNWSTIADNSKITCLIGNGLLMLISNFKLKIIPLTKINFLGERREISTMEMELCSFGSSCVC